MSALFADKYVVSLGKDLVADTTAETKTAVVDMAGYDEVTFLVKLGDVDPLAVLTFTVKENSANSTTSPTPTAVSIANATVGGTVTPVMTTGALVVTEDSGNLDDKLIVINVAKSAFTQRYCFLSITATTESYEADAIITVVGMPRSLPVTQPSDVGSFAKYQS